MLQEAGKRLLANGGGQFAQEDGAAPVDNGAVFDGGEFSNGLADRNGRFAHTLPATLQRLVKPIGSLLTIFIQVIKPGYILRQRFIQPRLIKLVIANETIKPLVADFVGSGRFKKVAVGHAVAIIIDANGVGNDAGVFHTQRRGGCGHEVKFGVGIRAKAG